MRSGPHLPVSSSSSFLLQKRSSPSLPAPSQSPSSEQVWGSGRPPRPPRPPCLPWIARQSHVTWSSLKEFCFERFFDDKVAWQIQNKRPKWNSLFHFDYLCILGGGGQCSNLYLIAGWQRCFVCHRCFCKQKCKNRYYLQNLEAYRIPPCRPEAHHHPFLPSGQHTGYSLCRPEKRQKLQVLMLLSPCLKNRKTIIIK